MKNFRTLKYYIVWIYFSFDNYINADMATTITETFGANPKDYVYNYQVWSDASVPIYIGQEEVHSVMGIFGSAGKIEKKQALSSIFNAQGALNHVDYNQQNYYFNIYMSTNKNPLQHHFYKEEMVQLPLKTHDSKVYYYHVYTGKHLKKGSVIHGPAVELLGYQDPNELESNDINKKGSVLLSTQLSSINFSNSSDTDVQISLTYGARPYQFTVEKYSYASLNLPTPQAQDKSNDSEKTMTPTVVKQLFSLRPNTISFSAVDVSSGKSIVFQTLKLPSQGFDGTKYTIEIFQTQGQAGLQVGVQGFNPGNYDNGAIDRVRDLTPCPVTFWYQSAQQANLGSGYIDLQGQVWIVYAGADSLISSQVMPGQVVSFQLTRPLLKQSEQYFYCVYVMTTDTKKAQAFVQKIIASQIGTDVTRQFATAASLPQVPESSVAKSLDVSGAIAPVVQVATLQQQVQALQGTLSSSAGAIIDTDQKIIGYILGADLFMPQGVGFGRFYYTLPPSIMSWKALAQLVATYLDSAKTQSLGGSNQDIQASIMQTLQSWFVLYLSQSSDLATKIESYLIKFGTLKLIDAAGKQLSPEGKKIQESIVSGAISLQYPAMKLSTMTNQYMFNFGLKAPDKMPNAVTQIGTSLV